MSDTSTASKVPAVTLGFWITKIAATTLGETGGDALSMTLKLGYAISTAVFLAFFLFMIVSQIRARTFHSALYWLAIVATTTAGTTMADFFDRSLGIGYLGGASALFALTLAVLVIWRFSTGSVSVTHITSPRVEAFYWATILASNTLGTALGDFLAASGPGYEGGAVVFAAALVVIAGLYFWTGLSRSLLFWAAFILTRPLGATLGDLLTKPRSMGGFDVSRFAASGAIAVVIILLVLLTPQRAGRHPVNSA